jgi:diguanylate cyclase
VGEAQSAGIRWMLRMGAFMVLVVWALEWRTGLINPWDRWLLPLMALAFAALAVLQVWQPRHDRWVRLGGALTFNMYLALSIQLLLASGGDNPNEYQFFTTLYWLPLAYGLAFVFLPVRWALGVAIGSFALTFLPLAVDAALGGASTRWPERFVTLVLVLAAAQVAYIVLLRTVATMRADYLLARERIQVVEALAGTDSLTGLPNRRAMTERLDHALAVARRGGQPLVVALFDVDYFKRINDAHGHAAGDKALIRVGQVLTAQLRASDHLGRWGGEEFLLVAPLTPLRAGMDLVERLRATIAAGAFDHGQPVTVSVGLSQ